MTTHEPRALPVSRIRRAGVAVAPALRCARGQFGGLGGLHRHGYMANVGHRHGQASDSDAGTRSWSGSACARGAWQSFAADGMPLPQLWTVFCCTACRPCGMQARWPRWPGGSAAGQLAARGAIQVLEGTGRVLGCVRRAAGATGRGRVDRKTLQRARARLNVKCGTAGP